ncbi:MAG: hypothetical protein SLRJCFUN_002547 [Candidatus Fervidibacter sp.]
MSEQTILLASTIKWFLLATLTGLAAGLAAFLFLRSLELAIEWSSQHPFYFLALPIALPLTVGLIRWLAPEAEGHGTEKVIEAIHERNGQIDPSVVPVKALATIVTLAAGGSVGKEGPCAQIGAGVASLVARLLHLSGDDMKKIVICGISAGFAAVFGTPVAGALFGVEVLFLGELLYDALLPSLVAGVTAFEVTHLLGLRYFSRRPPEPLPLTELSLLQSVSVGFVCGFVALVLIEAMRLMRHRLRQAIKNDLSRALVGGLALVVLGFLIPSSLGLGINELQRALLGRPVPFLLPFCKILATSITLESGGSGGIVTPIFLIGASTGNLLGALFGERATFAALGMVATLSAAANTPIAASVMAMEMFGGRIGLHAAVACVISFLVVGHRSVYPSQILAFAKSASLKVPHGVDIEAAEVEVIIREDSLSGLLLRYAKQLWQRWSSPKTSTPTEENAQSPNPPQSSAKG